MWSLDVTLLICPVRPGDSNEELRYAIRSWQTHLHLGSPLTLLTVGYKPTWLEPDHHVEGNRHASMPLAVWDNILLGTEEAIRLSTNDEDALYMTDDFFCLDPVGCVLPVRRNVSLAAQFANYPANTSHWWPKSLRLTASWLAEQGFPNCDSFECHRPLIARPSAMYEALLRWEAVRGDDTSGAIPQWRTVYGVLNEIEAYPIQDAKLSTTSSSGVGTPWISTSDHSWRRYAQSIKKRFPETSRWEV
jgi:hypothetical protein